MAGEDKRKAACDAPLSRAHALRAHRNMAGDNVRGILVYGPHLLMQMELADKRESCCGRQGRDREVGGGGQVGLRGFPHIPYHLHLCTCTQLCAHSVCGF